jgi:preprotein translocase subunit SecY
MFPVFKDITIYAAISRAAFAFCSIRSTVYSTFYVIVVTYFKDIFNNIKVSKPKRWLIQLKSFGLAIRALSKGTQLLFSTNESSLPFD